MGYPFENGLNSNRNRPTSSHNDIVSMDIALEDSRSTEGKLERFSETGDNFVEVLILETTVSEANGGLKKCYVKNGKKCYKGEHWSEKHVRTRKQKGSVALALRPLRSRLRMPCIITLTRYAPIMLDKYDNLPMSLKYILDAICEVITDDYRPGRADAHEGIQDVKYKQIKCKEYGVKIRIDY